MVEKTTIFLTTEDALLFVQYKKRYAFMKIMESVGAFNLKRGAITIEFDYEGQIKDIKKYEHFHV